ncbi:hypothetical protein [Vulcaniibacterium gelatinicum]|uniref:hypothetical protein n=1 Tax=Vulcaniibacterium gelatinicum TaxID=2598725 RepID=UPI0011C7C19D|nr:hypothetical protein [Vulcaniibacterium gelatinicum]
MPLATKTTHLPAELLGQVERYGAVRGLSTSGAIRALVEVGLLAVAQAERREAEAEALAELLGDRLAAVEGRLAARLDTALTRLDRVRDAIIGLPCRGRERG